MYIKTRTMTTKCLGNLDDVLLISIFRLLDPLPDLFNVSLTCNVSRISDIYLITYSKLIQNIGQRFHRLTTGRHMHVIVSPHDSRDARLHSRLGPHQSLAAAIEASRAGDTIHVGSGGICATVHDSIAPHRPLRVRWPLQIIGLGESPSDTVLYSSASFPYALQFLCTSRLYNLTIDCTLSSCILHEGGRLQLENCILKCDPRGLPHLFQPLVSSACSGSVEVRECILEHLVENSSREKECDYVSRPHVVGLSSKSSVLRDARAIHLSRRTYLWFSIEVS